jgi:hypothetical protein
METNCSICGKEIQTDTSTFNPKPNYALPMYEGKYDPKSKVDFPVCARCYRQAPKLYKIRQEVK